MTPFQQSRVWFRRASSGQRVATGGAGLLAVALFAWLLVPPSQEPEEPEAIAVSAVEQPAGEVTGSTVPAPAAGTQPQENAPAPADAAAPGTVAVPGPAAVGAAPAATPAAATAPGGRPCPAGTDQGATAAEVVIAITIINLAGAAGNGAFGVPSPAEQEEDWRLVTDAANAAGGAGCRKIVPKFFPLNPGDPNDAQRVCLAIAASKPFAAMDAALGAAGDCIPAQKIPLFVVTLRKEQVDRYYPYYFTTGDIADNLLRNGVLGLKERGFFSAQNGFSKLGFPFRSCLPQLVALQRQALRDAGIPDNKVVPFDFGCPGGFASPAAIQQAILKFSGEGVTHVTLGPKFEADFANFTKVAQQQRFKPKYGFAAGDGIVAVSGGALSPDHDNLDGAINITGGRFAEDTTPGSTPSAGTAKCNAIYTAKKRPPVYEQKVGFGGVVCGFVSMFVALLDNAPRYERAALASAIPALKTMDFPFPGGPADFASSGARATFGRAGWRPQRFLKSCGCWRVEDPNFKPFFR